jgi:branched-chain amino acid transport system permease protein
MSGYTEGILILLCINAIAAMGVSLLTGFTGIFSLGHAAYMALGAYTTAILTVQHGVHWLPYSSEGSSPSRSPTLSAFQP